jgi:tRNA pseudouridine38-40 synthase
LVRYQVILAYDGTEFSGFQRQANARTVQGVVEQALRQLNWQGRAILSAGRTDTGVHAAGQVIAFDLDWAHSQEDLLHALNAHLPDDAAARWVSLAPPGFHPRFAARARRYCYHIFCDPLRDPLRERYAWRVWPAAQLDLLQQSAGALVGTHDFAAFGTPQRAAGSTKRTVLSAEWKLEGTGLVFAIVANAFLYHMVRHLVSLQIEIGQGRSSVEVIRKYLQGEMPSPVQGLAPPQGLVLVEVEYPAGDLESME